MTGKRLRFLFYAIVAIYASTYLNGIFQSQLANAGFGEKNILVKVQHSRVYIYTALPVFRHSSFEAAEKSKQLYNVNAIAITAFEIRNDWSVPFRCCYMLQNGSVLSLTSSMQFPYRIAAIRRAIQIFCPLVHSLSLIRSVSLAFNKTSCSTNEQYYKEITNINPPARNEKNEKTIAVCLKLSYGELDVGILVEWLEALRIFGVDSVLTHAYQLNPAARKVYQNYGRTGFTEVMEFDFPEKEIANKLNTINKQGWNDEQVAVYNCQAKLLWYDYVIILDSDEFLLPKTDVFKNGWRTLFEEVFQRPEVASVNFWTVLHITTWGPTNPRHPLFIGKYNNVTVPLIDREKQVYVPTKVVLGSIETHQNKPLEGYKRKEIKPEKAVVHHYRSCRMEWLDTRVLNDTVTRKRFEWLESKSYRRLIKTNDTFFFGFKTERYCFDLHRFYSKDMEKLSIIIRENVSRILTHLHDTE